MIKRIKVLETKQIDNEKIKDQFVERIVELEDLVEDMKLELRR